MDPSCFSAASAAFYKLALRHPEQFHISQSCSSASNDPDCSNATVFRLAVSNSNNEIRCVHMYNDMLLYLHVMVSFLL